MNEKGLNKPSYFLKSAEFCLTNHDPNGAVDNFIRAATSFQELSDWEKAAKCYSRALTVIERETLVNEKGLKIEQIPILYRMLLAKNSCLFNLGLIHILWLEKYSLAKIFFIESHKPLNRANTLLKEHTDYFSNLIDPQIKDIVGVTPLQTELLTFAFSSSIFSFFSALLDIDTDRIEEYFTKLKKLEDLFVSEYFEPETNSFFTLLGKLAASIPERNLASFNEIKTNLDNYYSNCHKSPLYTAENQKQGIKLLDNFLNVFEDVLLKIFDALKNAFFTELDDKG